MSRQWSEVTDSPSVRHTANFVTIYYIRMASIACSSKTIGHFGFVAPHEAMYASVVLQQHVLGSLRPLVLPTCGSSIAFVLLIYRAEFQLSPLGLRPHTSASQVSPGWILAAMAALPVDFGSMATMFIDLNPLRSNFHREVLSDVLVSFPYIGGTAGLSHVYLVFICSSTSRKSPSCLV
jgi:hypothetical protein